MEDLREIGWKYWDPIGLAGSGDKDNTQAEYDSYLVHVTRCLLDGGSDEAAVDYLCTIAADHMGLGTADRKAAVETVAAIRQHIDKLGPRTP